MGSSFESLWREVTGLVPQLDAKQAQKFVQRAKRDIEDASHWSFLYARTVVEIPASISTGTVSVTRNSSTITFNAAAIVVLDAIGTADPVTSRQIQLDGGTPYQILTYTTGTGVATITPSFPNSDTNPGYLGDTDTASTYVIAKRYYPPPSTDFLRWISVVNQTVPYRFWTGIPTSIIDLYDPKRMIVGNPYAITQFAAGTDPAGSGAEVPLYELWPTPAYSTPMIQIYQKRSTAFSSNSDTLPSAIPDDLLMSRAKYLAFQWAMANQGRFPELKGTNWAALMQLQNGDYKEELWKAKKQDRETFANAAIVPANNYGYFAPMWDANYNQISSLNADLITGQYGWPI